MNREDGGPAFPGLEEFQIFDEDSGRYVDHYAPANGMSLRDWFAGQALIAMHGHKAVENTERGVAWLADHAYLVADAMLKERAK